MGYLSFLPLWICLWGASPVSPQQGPSLASMENPMVNWYTVTPSGVLCDKAGPYLLSGCVSPSPIGMDVGASFQITSGFWSAECEARSNPGREEVFVSSQKPGTFKLYPNSPNPFRQSTRIAYDLSVRSRVFVGIYDVDGRQVRKLADGWQDAGRYSLKWDGQDARGKECPAGVYFCSASTEDRGEVRKVLITE